MMIMRWLYLRTLVYWRPIVYVQIKSIDTNNRRHEGASWPHQSVVKTWTVKDWAISSFATYGIMKHEKAGLSYSHGSAMVALRL